MIKDPRQGTLAYDDPDRISVGDLVKPKGLDIEYTRARKMFLGLVEIKVGGQYFLYEEYNLEKKPNDAP